MTPEAQNIAISELVGFDLWVIVKCGAYYRANAGGYTNSLAEAWKLPLAEAKKYEMYADRDDIPGCEKVLLERAPIPNYAGDLNAMHEAQKALTHIQQLKIAGQLGEIHGVAWGVRSTAAEHAEAFLKVLGKWTDEPTKGASRDA